MYCHAGPLEEKMQMGFDWEYWMRLISLGYSYECETEILGASYRLHKDCKGKKDNLSIRCEQMESALRYVSKNDPDYFKIRKNLHKRIAYYLVRIAQRRDNGEKIINLLRAIYYSPGCVTDPAFIGTLLRTVIPGYGAWRKSSIKN